MKAITEKYSRAALKDLCRAILSLSTVEEGERFFTDLCTPAELRAMADRWKVAKLLNQEIPYREIYDRTGVSTATITRVARALLFGESGYRKVLDRLGRGKE
jgi:TrpR-related protein YerC/YecD